MRHRFYVPHGAVEGGDLVLPDEEGAHLSRVLRLGAGDDIRVFDGRGAEWDARVMRVERARVTVRVGLPRMADPEPRVDIRLGVAVLKGDRMDDVVRDATMLGATAVTPLVTARSEVSRAALARGRKVTRWHRIAVASAKQCGRAVVPTIHEPRELTEHLQTPAEAVRLMLVEPRAGRGDPVPLSTQPRASAAELLVGPEGGWTEGEIDFGLASGAMLVTLGALTLRADAVPLVAVSALRAVWFDL